jgi:uncharacterized membrane protein YGL010W
MIRLGPDWQRLMDKYELAHQDPRNQACHAIGIPMIAASLPIAATVIGLPLGASMFTVGWGFQFLGHWFEGTDPEFLSDKRSLVIGLIWWLRKRGVDVVEFERAVAEYDAALRHDAALQHDAGPR